MKTVQRFDFLKIVGKPTLTDEGFLVCPVAATRAGVFIYHDSRGREIRELRPKAEVSKRESLETLVGKPATNKHPASGLLNAATARAHTVGSIGSDVKMDGDHVVTECRVYDGPTIKEILDGKEEVSCGYTAELEDTPGEDPEYGHYDSIQKNIKYNHLAVALDRGRGGPSVRMRLDSAQNQITEVGMAKIKIDGKEYEMDDAAASAVKKVMDDADVTRKLLDEADKELKADEDEDVTEPDEKEDKLDSYPSERIATAKRKVTRKFMDSWNKAAKLHEALKGRLAGLEGQRMDSMSPEKLAQGVQERFKVVAVAAARMDGEKVADLAKFSDMDLKKKVLVHVNPEMKLDGKSAEFIDGAFDALASQVSQAETGRVLGEMLIPTESSQARPGTSSAPRKDGWKQPLTAMKS